MPVAALTGLKNGHLLDYPETLRLMEALVSEAVGRWPEKKES